MTVVTNHEGLIIIDELVIDQFNNEFYHEMVYQGYTLAEAKARFKAHLKREGLKVSR